MVKGRFTKSEDAVLREHFKRLSNKEIGALLARPEKAVAADYLIMQTQTEHISLHRFAFVRSGTVWTLLRTTQYI